MRAAAMLLALAACHAGMAGGAGGDDDVGATTDAGADVVDAAPDAVPLPAACAAGVTVPENDTTWTISTPGGDRTFFVHLPPAYLADPHAPVPLVLNFHGYSNSAATQRDWSNLDDTSNAEGFIVVYPEGTGVIEGWNAGDCCGNPALNDTDDVGFVMQMVDELEGRLCIDVKRVYASGFSNGGFLSHRLACEHAERFAAIASVSGVMGIDDCEPSRPMPVWMAHGTSDPVVPYDGSAVLGFRSVQDTLDGWVARDGCLGAPVQTFHQGDTDCEAYYCADSPAAVELCTIDGGSHTWPNGDTPVLYTSRDLDADSHIWAFFQEHPLP